MIGPRRLAAKAVRSAGPRRWLRVLDAVALRAVVELDRGPLGEATSSASVLADRGRVWPVAVAGLLLLPSRRTRRAAVAGACAVAAEAGLSHLLKPLARQPRPPWWQRLRARDRGHRPSSWSMPSSHAGDAAAFAAAAGAQSRRLGVPFGLFAALISVSRITTARHYPSDVTVGVLTGIAVGLLVGRTPAVGTAVLASRHDDQRSPAS